jgi:hypothetical protein
MERMSPAIYRNCAREERKSVAEVGDRSLGKRVRPSGEKDESQTIRKRYKVLDSDGRRLVITLAV